MIPGVNPRQMQQMMKQMGMSQDSIDATQVIIKTASGEQIIFDSPDVQKISMRGQDTFQLSGEYRTEVEKAKIEISDEDIEMVSEQANVSKDDAKLALENNDGDIAQAIVSLTE